MEEFVVNIFFYIPCLMLIALTSIFICSKMNNQRITAERAFWAIWIFLIVSAEIITNFDYFEYPYSIDFLTRSYTLGLFLTSAVAFIFATVIYSILNRKANYVNNKYRKIDTFYVLNDNKKVLISIMFFVIGLVEFFVNFIMHGSLIDVRLNSIDSLHSGFSIYLYIFYIAYAYLMLLAYIDGNMMRRPNIEVLFLILGLIFHGLSVGGRINIIFSPIIYVVGYLSCANIYDKKTNIAYFKSKSFFLKLLLLCFIIFSIIGILRNTSVEFSYILTIDGFVNKILLAVPRYITDAYVSISINAHHAIMSGEQYGRFTFDFLYRILIHLGIIDYSSSDIFGQLLYRDSPAPWGWTQVNVIPRFIADYGCDFFLVMFFLFAFLSQLLSLMLVNKGFVKHSISTLAIVSNIYSIQDARWLSSSNVIIIFFCIVLRHVFSRHHNKN